MTKRIASTLQLLGLSVGVAAGLTVSLGVGLAIAAVGLIVFGVALER